MSQFTPLTPAQRERMTKLVQELMESGVAATKILEHGFVATDGNGVTYDNRADLQRELGDILAAAHLMFANGDIDGDAVLAAGEVKKLTVTRYMHFQGEPHA